MKLMLLLVSLVAILPLATYLASDGEPHVPQQAPANGGVSITLKAPNTLKVGQLAVLDVSESDAASFAWQVEPACDGFLVIDGGKRAVFSTSVDDTANSYLFIVAAAKGDTVAVKTWRVAVTGREKPTNDTDANLIAKVAQWCNTIESPTKKADLAKLAQSFASVAEAAKSSTMTPDSMVQATSQANSKALGPDNLKNWAPFFVNLQNELKALDAAGKLPDGLAHIAAWEQIADGLNEYAATL